MARGTVCDYRAGPMTEPRRTQVQRREETRAKLLDAVISCVDEFGYAGATTRRIADRAGVSMGAVTHHFPYRVDLVAAAVEELTERRIAGLQAAVLLLDGTPDQRVSSVLDLMWADFSGELFTVMVKLWIAAGDDAELHERMVPIERLLARSFASFAGELTAARPRLLPPGPEDDTAAGTDAPRRTASLGVDPRYAVVVTALRGLALSRAFEPRSGVVRAPWPAYRAELERYLLS